MGSTERLRGRCWAKLPRAGAWPWWHGWVGRWGFAAVVRGCTTRLQEPCMGASVCESQMGSLLFQLKGGCFRYRALYSGDLPSISSTPLVFVEGSSVPGLLPTALALQLRCRQRLLLCRERAPRHLHTPSPSPFWPFWQPRSESPSAASAWGGEGTGGHLGTSSLFPEDASGWSMAGPC